MLPVAILAGGLATRLHQFTQRIPKSLIEVAGAPFIEHQLRLLRRERVVRVVLCVAHLGEMIRDRVGDGSRFGLDVAYSFDGDRLLGTGGALRLALPLLGPSFFVLYGDSYLDIGFAPVQATFQRMGLPALMTVFRNDGRWDTSNVLFDGTKVIRYDKRAPTRDMHYIDYGLGVFTSDVLAVPAAETLDLAELYAALAGEGRLAGLEVSQRFYEIGTPAGLAETNAYLRERQ